ncbi:MAG TPA: trehalase family glycosidase [Candidatus Acidoferrales bacterium]
MALAPQTPSIVSPSTPASLHPILEYIENGWDALTRSFNSCSALDDSKTKAPGFLYLPADYAAPTSLVAFAKTCEGAIRRLPAVIRNLGEIDPNAIDPPGLLYLEHPYVVPGGRFNEMYGWDSYFIVRGLLEDDRHGLARNMVENAFFEIEHYGAILNANRTYYLSRSQQPYLTSMILSVYTAENTIGTDDRAWLERAYELAQRDYALWNRPPHVAGNTGLSNYHGFGQGPAPEELKDDPDYYRTVATYFEKDPELARRYLVPPDEDAPEIAAIFRHFTSSTTDPSAGRSAANGNRASTLVLSADFYTGDRAVRESGFDITFRFGPFGAATHHFAPVCLNSLLYKAERDLEEIACILLRHEESKKWADRASARREAINRYLWDSARGLFFDYDFVDGKRSTYNFATAFYPLWVGLATPEQARAVAGNLEIFERPGGIVTSTTATGVQWDEPYAWAPLQLIAIEGLRRYGFADEANRISHKFLSMVLDDFRRDGTIREKYDAVKRSSEVCVEAGYPANVIGFGWTNGVFLALLSKLSSEWLSKFEK